MPKARGGSIQKFLGAWPLEDVNYRAPKNTTAPHILKVTGKAAASLYALKTLKAHGLHGQALCDVTQATLVLLHNCSTQVQHGPGSSKRM